MVFVKVYKTKAYFKRYQTRFRRRREGKTDYYARKRLITQDRNKYDTAKYRLVARITCSRVICQVIYATISGDRVLCAADSTELKRYGLEAGLTNYAACYATGLLCARRLLHKTGLDKLYAGAKKIDGEDYDVHKEVKGDQRRPFKAVLDVGLIRTTTGARVFGCLKGACDGGLHVPHSTKRFPGYTKEKGNKETYNAKVHRERIFGLHVEKYMKTLKEKGNFDRQFSKWDANMKKTGVTSLEKLYTKVHEEIRKNPIAPAKKEKKKVEQKYLDKKKSVIQTGNGKKYKRDQRLTREERQKNVTQKIAKALKA
jgi:large subunit ribosomal protein L5e